MAATESIILKESVNDMRNVEYLLEILTVNDFEDKKDFYKIKNYLDKFLKDEELSVKYKSAFTSPYGRLYGNGIQNVSKDIRGFLCNGLTTDIDFKNCHPTILYYTCKKHEIKCDFLTQYIIKRDEILNTLSTELNKSRDDIKIEIIKSINYEKNKLDVFNNYFLTNLEKEIKNIQFILYNTNEYQWVVDEVKNNNKKEYNLKGSFISHLACYIENIMLMFLYDFLINKNYNIHSLMFDGLMIYGNHYEDDELLKECNELIKEEFGELHELVYKPHCTNYKIPEEYKTANEIYKELKEEFSINNFKMRDQYGNVTKSGVTLYNKANFITLHEENYSKKFLNKWFFDPCKNNYEAFGCYPNDDKCPDNIYNLWDPFECVEHKPAEDDDGLNWFLNHIKTMCNYNNDVCNFVLMWLAQMVQYPEMKSVQLVFRTRPGTGKGLFLQFLKNMLGTKKVYECSDPQNQIFGNQNGILKNSFLIIFEEMEKSFFNKAIPKLKTLITDPTIIIRELYQKPFQMNSYHRFIGFTNKIEQTVLERRQVFIEGSDDKIGNSEYFNEGYKYSEDQKIARKIYDYLMKYPTKPKINKNDCPVTAYQKELQEMNKDPFDVWIEAFINNYEDWTPVGDIYKNYRDWYRINGYHVDYFNCTTIQFGLKLKRTGLMTKGVKRVGAVAVNCWKKTIIIR